MSDIKTINKQLKTAIFNIKRDFGLKQSEIADQLGIKSTYLSDMINGGVPFSESISNKIYEIFHIRVEEKETDILNEPSQSYGLLCKKCDQKDQSISELVGMLKEKESEIKQMRDLLKNRVEEWEEGVRRQWVQEEKNKTG